MVPAMDDRIGRQNRTTESDDGPWTTDDRGAEGYGRQKRTTDLWTTDDEPPPVLSSFHPSCRHPGNVRPLSLFERTCLIRTLSGISSGMPLSDDGIGRWTMDDRGADGFGRQ